MHDEAHRRFGVIFRNRKPALLEEIKKIAPIGIILTGGLAHSHYVTGYLTQKLSFIAPVEVMAGEFELEALAAGASRVLNGQEQPRRFADIPQA